MDTQTVTAADELAFAGAAEQARMLAGGTVSSRQLVELYLDRIARYDGGLRAFRSVFAERARAHAAVADRRLADGDRAPLLGVPIAVKENLDVAGEPTTHGLRGRPPTATADAEAVARLEAAGAVILGHTAMPELAAWGHRTDSPAHGITRNPWDTARSPGGSSGGSAVAVAAGLAAAAIGTDGGGSIRIPAACCGLVGLKPQRDRVPLTPDDDHWSGLTAIGPITRTVADAALLLEVLAGAPLAGDTSVGVAGLRVAVSTRPVLPCRPSADVLAAVETTARVLREAGCTTVARDPNHGELRPLFVPRWSRGVWEDARRLGATELERPARGLVRVGARMGAASEHARRAAPDRARRINRVFEDADLLLTPMTAAGPPPAGDGSRRGAVRTLLGGTRWVAYSVPWNLTGQPAIALPVATGADGLPIGVQLVAPPDGEALLLRVAAHLESIQGWPSRRPALERTHR